MGKIKMRHMKKGQRGKIISIKAEGSSGRRIRDMGIIPGAEITIVGRAPLRDPVAVRLKDFTLTLRNNEADLIEVEIDDE